MKHGVSSLHDEEYHAGVGPLDFQLRASVGLNNRLRDEMGASGRQLPGAHARDLPAGVWRRLIDTLLPVGERRDADTELTAEVGDAQVRLPLPLELCSPPIDP